MGKKVNPDKVKKVFLVSAKDGITEINKPQDLSYGIPDKWKNLPGAPESCEEPLGALS